MHRLTTCSPQEIRNAERTRLLQANQLGAIITISASTTSRRVAEFIAREEWAKYLNYPYTDGELVPETDWEFSYLAQEYGQDPLEEPTEPAEGADDDELEAYDFALQEYEESLGDDDDLRSGFDLQWQVELTPEQYRKWRSGCAMLDDDDIGEQTMGVLGVFGEPGIIPACAYDMHDGYGSGYHYPFVHHQAYVSEFPVNA